MSEEIIDPEGLKGGPGRQAQLVCEYRGRYRVHGDNPPMVVAENGEAMLSMMWPVHEQTPEGEQAAVEYTTGLATKIAELLNQSPDLTAANATIAELRQSRDMVDKVYIQEAEELLATRDRLTAELESLKRERDEAQRAARSWEGHCYFQRIKAQEAFRQEQGHSCVCRTTCQSIADSTKCASDFGAQVEQLTADLATARKELETERAAVELLRKELAEARAQKSKTAPVQGYAAGIPWEMHLRAYAVYCQRYGPQPAMIDLEGRNCRGGFHADELDNLIPGWREELSLAAKHSAVAQALANRLVVTNSVLTALATKHSDVPTDTIEANAKALADFKSKSETK